MRRPGIGILCSRRWRLSSKALRRVGQQSGARLRFGQAIKGHWRVIGAGLRFGPAIKGRWKVIGAGLRFGPAIKGCWRVIGAALRFGPAIKGRWKVIGAGLRFGIAARLVAAFIGVAALVVAANLIVVQGVLVERITQIPTPPVVAAAPVAPPAAVEPPPPPKIIVERREITSDALSAALERYTRAAEDRVKANSEQSAAEYQQSSADLDRASATFTTQAASISGKPFSKLSAAVNAHKEHGDELVGMADNRSAMLLKFSTSFEALNARVNASMADAWKISACGCASIASRVARRARWIAAQCRRAGFGGKRGHAGDGAAVEQ